MPHDSSTWADQVSEALAPPEEFRWTALDLFAGCGGLALGFEAAGFRTIGFEMDRDAAATYNKNLQGDCYEEFLTEDTQLPRADVVIGGPPCQPFSVGGSQKGHQDDRDGFPAFIAAVEQVQPRVFLFENVRGMLYRNKPYFKAVLRTLEGLGYEIEERLLNAVDYGVPQRRERVVVVGHRSAFRFPEPLGQPHVTVGDALGGLLQHAPEDARYLTPAQDAYIARYEMKSKCVRPRDLHPEIPSRTVTCRNLAGATSDMLRIALPDGRRRRVTVREAARLQSFPDWFVFTGAEGRQFDQVGNAVAPLFSYHLATAIAESLEGRTRTVHSPNEPEALTLFQAGEEVDELSSRPSVEDVLERLRTKSKTFKEKTAANRALIEDALRICNALGLPMGELITRPRLAERRALALLAIAGVDASNPFGQAKDVSTWAMTSREIIDWQNSQFEESRSSGSYDDVRREDLLWLRLAGIAENTGDIGAGAKNSPVRRYGLSAEAAQVLKTYGTNDWPAAVKKYMGTRVPLSEELSRPRRMTTQSVSFPGSSPDSHVTLNFGPGGHNELIKACIEDFLPRWGKNAQVLYVGDADDRTLWKADDRLAAIGVPDLGVDELPDVVAYAADENWLFVIEAVHSSGPVSREKHMRYREFFQGAKYGVVYVTAFASRDKFREHAGNIAWETEVWIAQEPTHLVHYNGGKFLGPHQK